MYASAFVANLGSIKIDAAYHHLYEHGNCPLFVTVGQIQPRPVADGAEVAVRPTAMLRYTYDERIEDGLYCAAALELLRRRIEDPASVTA
jgi:pyruvate/2-oxoglutarate dehydrogenase complex dihydrolipoamide acyltransferase (E2) component